MQLHMDFDALPALDEVKTRQAFVDAMDKYRICKYLIADEREASTTASYSDMPRSNTGVTSDQTASIALHNVAEQQFRKDYCERIERAVSRLDRRGRVLITERYMNEDGVTDDDVMEDHLKLGRTAYYNLKWRTVYKLALILRIEVRKETAGA